jgi:hypothetical protein
MTRPTLDRAMRVTMACLMLLSLAPATAGAWMPQTTGTMGTMQPRGQTARIETSGDDAERAGRGTQGLSLLLFISGILLGVLLGLCVRFRVPQGWRERQRRRRDIDRLTAQFQALFRESDQGKNHSL